MSDELKKSPPEALDPIKWGSTELQKGLGPICVIDLIVLIVTLLVMTTVGYIMI
jgi:hypothetical protein